MKSPGGARTPEELEMLFEDAFLLRDAAALVQLFDAHAVLAAPDGQSAAHGRAEIAGVLAELWAQDCAYLAGGRRVLQARDTAVVLGGGSVHVLRRGEDRSWRYAISLLEVGGVR